MAITVLNKLIINNTEYEFILPTWLVNDCINNANPDSSGFLSGSKSELYNIWNPTNPTIATFPFAYKTYQNTYRPNNPQNTTINTGVVGNYFRWQNLAPPTKLFIALNGSEFDAPSGGSYFAMLFCWIFGIDEAEQKGYAWRILLYSATFPDETNMTGVINAYHDNGSTEFYTFLKDIAPTIYTWQSVAGVYGKSGHVVFSHVLDDTILTGSDIEDLNADAFAFYGATCIDRLIANVPVGTEVTAFYSGDFNHLTVTKGELSLYVTLKMYVEGHIVEIDITRPTNTDGWASGFLGYIIDSENQVAKLIYIKEQGNALLIPTGIYDLTVPGTQDETTMGYIYTFLHGHTDDESENESENEDVNEADPGTDPEYQSDIGVTGISKPAYGAYDTGFTTQYRMTAAELKALASTLWSNNFWDNIKKFFEDPREIIIGVSLMPVTPDTGSSKEVKAGGISTGVYGLPLTDQYKFDTYGTCRVKAEKGNFLDYNPFTKVTAHLPFVGVHSLDVNDVMGKKLTLKYIFDFMTGCCVAEIDVNGKPRYFFGGSCGMQIPVSSEDFGRTYSS